MDSSASRAATAAAVGALTDFLAEQDAGTPRGMADYLQQLIADDGAGALAQGYYGLLNLSAYLLPLAAEQEGVAPRELLTRIGLAVATEPDEG